jgi:hypothetical protein
MEQEPYEITQDKPAPRPTDWQELKLALNQAVWMYAPPSTTLAQAEEATIRAISYLCKCEKESNK